MQAIDIRFQQALDKAIQGERNKVANELSRGMATDFAEYKYACGILEGMKRVQDLANQLVNDANASSKDIFANT